MFDSKTEVILIGKTESKTDEYVLIVGKKYKGESISIINAFDGEEAKELWDRLTIKKEK